MSSLVTPVVGDRVHPPELDGPPRSRLRRRSGWTAELGRGTGLVLAAPFIALAAAFVIYPFFRLVQIAGGGDGYSANLRKFFDNRANVRSLVVTITTSLMVTVIAVCAGSIVAWSLRTCRSRLMKLALTAAVLLPFWMGTVMKQYAWSTLLQGNGVLNSVLVDSGLVDSPVKILYTRLAVVIGMVYQMLPYAVLPAFAAFRSIDLNLVSAAESLGASRPRALVNIVIPLALPGLFATATVVYVISIGFYLTPVVLGGMSTPFTATLIHQNIFVFYSLEAAAFLAVALVLAAVLVLLVSLWAVGGGRLKRALG